MKKVILLGLAVMLVVGLFAVPIMAAPAGKDIPANENSQNLYLYPKVDNPGEPEWTTLWETEAWGKFNFKINGQMISGVFNGHGLVAGTDYTLISYNDPWGGTPQLKVIGEGTAKGNGNVHINVKVPVDLGADVESPIYDWHGAGDGYKIWLVLSADIEGGQFNDWNPDSYLFENNRIGATATP